MSERLAELRRILGDTRLRVGALAERLAAVGARLGATGVAAAADDSSRRAEPPLGATDIEALDLKFEAIADGLTSGSISGAAAEKPPEG